MMNEHDDVVDLDKPTHRQPSIWLDMLAVHSQHVTWLRPGKALSTLTEQLRDSYQCKCNGKNIGQYVIHLSVLITEETLRITYPNGPSSDLNLFLFR